MGLIVCRITPNIPYLTRSIHTQELVNSELANYLTLTQDTQSKIDRFNEEFELMKASFLSELNVTLAERLSEERTRVEQLEQQLNDLTELHQNEMENLKSTMTDMEEKVSGHTPMHMCHRGHYAMQSCID